MKTPWAWWRERRQRLDDEAITTVTLLGYKFTKYWGRAGALPRSIRHERGDPDNEPTHWGCMNYSSPEIYSGGTHTYQDYLRMRAGGAYASTPAKAAREVLKRRRKAKL